MAWSRIFLLQILTYMCIYKYILNIMYIHIQIYIYILNRYITELDAAYLQMNYELPQKHRAVRSHL